MNIQMFNGWYFLFLGLSIGIFVGLYFLLKNKSQKTIKIVLFSILIFAIVLHFMKVLFPPYSTNSEMNLRDSWFINICGANIGLFPIMFLSKNKHVKDYMFYLGLFGGLIAILYPMELMLKANQAAEWIDVVRFYIHHNILWQVPLLMILLKVHSINYKRVWAMPIIFLGVLLFVMLNQVLQSELGFIGLRGDDIHSIPYINNSFIWCPHGDLSKSLTWACPEFFKTIPVGPHAGEAKYWPWFWLIFPSFIILTPLCFLVSLIFEHKHLKEDLALLKIKFQNLRERKLSKEPNEPDPKQNNK